MARDSRYGCSLDSEWCFLDDACIITRCPFREVEMVDLTKEEIRALGHAVGLEIVEPYLTEVMYSLNAILEALDGINPPGLDEIEPLPIILPPPPQQ
jgi:hypothetical protein